LPFGVQLRSQRLVAGLTQAELAGQVGLSNSTLRNYEYGRAKPNPRTLAKLVEVLGEGLRLIKE
jgi:transcriptional regulator with XRE-family HTH domain